jgi:O-antigen/teichoic acid export membrane protein
LRTQRSILNYATVVLFTVVTTLTALVTTPLLLGWLGKERFGAYRMINGWYGYLTLLDFGLGAALSPLLARALGKGEAKTLERTLATGMRAYLWLTLLILGVGLAMTPFIHFLIPVRLAIVGDLQWAWMICVLSFLPLSLAPFRTLAEARQHSYWINALMTVQCLLITAMSLLFARAGWGISGQAWAFSLGITAFFTALAWIGLRRHRGLVGSALTAPPDPEIRSSIWNLSWPSLMISVSNRMGLLSDNLIAGGFLGSTMAGLLDITVRLPGLAQTQIQAIGGASWAGLAELHAQGARDIFNRRLLELTTLVTVLGIAALGPIAAYSRYFVDQWVGPGIFRGEVVALIATANALLLGLFTLWGWCFTGTGQVRRIMVPTVVATVVNLVASLVLTWRLGVVGPALGTLVANLTISIWWLPALLRRVFGIAPRTLIGAVAWPLAWGLPYAAGLWWAAHVHQPWGWFGLLAEMGGAALAFLVLSSLVILSPTDRALWRMRLLGLLQLWENRTRSNPDQPGDDTDQPPGPSRGPSDQTGGGSNGPSDSSINLSDPLGDGHGRVLAQANDDTSR